MPKRCSACRLERPAADFGINRAAKDGLQYACRACLKKREPRYKDLPPDRKAVKKRAKSRRREERRKSDPAYAAKLAASRDRWVAANHGRHSEKYRAAHLRRQYGLTVEAYRDLEAAQGGLCAICRRPPKGRRNGAPRLVVDHCHETGVVRGLLCWQCNVLLGQLGDNEAGVRRVLDYLGGEKSQPGPSATTGYLRHERCPIARNEAPPFGRGETFFGTGGTPNTTDGANLEGKTWVFEDIDISQQGARPARSNRDVKCMVVRNLSGGALLPKRVAKMKLDGTAREYLGQVSGYADTVGQRGYPIDEFLPAAGVAANDLFWVVVEGPATCTTDASGDTNISTGSRVIPATNGKVVDQDTTVALAPGLYNQIQGAIGRCILAVNATDTDILIDVGH